MSELEKLARTALGLAKCTFCPAIIADGEARDIWYHIHVAPRGVDGEGHELPAGIRQFFGSFPVCEICAASDRQHVLPNVAALLVEELADPSAGPESEDAAHRFVQGNAELAELGGAPTPPTKADLRDRLRGFIASTASQDMPAGVRKVAELWTNGATQLEISSKLRIHQATTSRRLARAMKMLYAKNF